MPKRQLTTKAYKIRRDGEAKKVGVAASSLKELTKKACGLLQVPVLNAQCCLYEDGTILTEEYFFRLPDHTELILLSAGQSWNGMVCDLLHALGLNKHSEDLINTAQQLLTDKHSDKRRKILGDLLSSLIDKAELESKEEDKDWFEGLDVRFKTKSSYMNHNCAQRIRGYLKEVVSHAQTIPKTTQKSEYQKVAASLAEKLKSMSYHGHYFDRTEKERYRLCTKEGWFSCQVKKAQEALATYCGLCLSMPSIRIVPLKCLGAFDQKRCNFLHSINPYGNRESRILFSTWNLDHRIEKKRTVIPTLVEALHGKKSSELNLDYFYNLLFTTENLKLVHIVCHKKGAHDLTCDLHRVYRQGKKACK